MQHKTSMGLGMLRVTKVVALSLVAPKHDHDASTANNKGVSLQFRDAKWISAIKKLRRFLEEIEEIFRRNWGFFSKKKLGFHLFHGKN